MTTFRNLDPLMNPKSIAIVGASDAVLRLGGRPIDYMKRLGFAGKLYPVNPKRERVQDLPAFASLSAIGAPVDLAIVAAPAAAVEEIVAEGIGLGIPAFVVFSSGFAEYCEQGAAMQERLQQMCDGAGALLLGPNCLGAINVRQRMVASFTTAMEADAMIEGGFGFVSQSGALGAYWLDMVFQRGLGVSGWIATGNEAGITVADAIHHMAHDPHTRVIGCYIEDIKNGAAFRDAVLAAHCAGKPVLLIKAGRSSTGAAAAASHTGALAGEDVRYQALFDEIGIARVNSLSEMVAAARLLLLQPMTAGHRVGIVTVSGGAGVMLADDLDSAGFSVPPFDDATRARVDAALPGFVSANNPLDVTGGVAGDPGIFRQVLDALGTAPEHDLFVLFIGLMASISEELSESLVATFGNAGKPVAVVWIGARQPVVAAMERHGIPVFADIPEAVGALAAMRHLAKGIARASGLASRARPRALPAPASLTGESEVRAQSFIRANCALAFPTQVLVHDLAQTRAARETLRGALAVKLQSPDMLHKSENGGVRLGIREVSELVEAVSGMLDIAGRQGLRLDGVLIQEMAPIAHELIVGFKRDAVFGPILLIGRGGVDVELRPDRVMRYMPLDAADVRAMIGELASAPLLDGWRGGPVGDLEALSQDIARLAAAFGADESIEEIEINPLALTRDGRFIALDALLLRRSGH